MYFPISNTWIVKQTPFGALLAVWLQAFSFQWMMWLFDLVWMRCQRKAPFIQHNRIFVSLVSCQTQSNFILVLHQDQLSTCQQQWTDSTLGLLFSTCSSSARKKSKTSKSTQQQSHGVCCQGIQREDSRIQWSSQMYWNYVWQFSTTWNCLHLIRNCASP